jgi:hypothetical protein
MTIAAQPAVAVPRGGAACDRPAAVTRSLPGYGPLAGVVHLVPGTAQALTRDGST